MFDNESTESTAKGARGLVLAVRALAKSLAASAGVASSAEGLELIGALEQLKGVAEGLQLHVTAEVLNTQREEAGKSGPHAAARVTRSVGHQVALARRTSPAAGRRCVQLAAFVRAGLPKVYAALRAGATSEWTVSLIARETAVLSPEHRAEVDEAIAGDPARLTLMGPLTAQARVRQLVAELDPAAVVARRRRAESERRVALRPAPDGMTWLSALMPLAAGVATLGALSGAADSARAAGDERTRGQLMADELALRVAGVIAGRPTGAGPTGADPTSPRPGESTADPTRWGGAYSEARERDARTGGPAPVPTEGDAHVTAADDDGSSSCDADRTGESHGTSVGVMINLIMTDQQLFGSGPPSEGTAWCENYGPIDADLAREMARGAPSPSDRVWIRRLFTDRDGRLAAMDSRARFFPAGVRTMIKLCDQVCRTPWCNAPIRHIDHVVDHAAQGQTTLENGQGTCEACNYAKQAPGWSMSACPVSGRITVKTPGGQSYETLPPPLPGIRYRRSPVEVEMVFASAA